MDCPHCKDPMIVFEWSGVELDHCLGCRGIWLDAGELELLTGQAAVFSSGASAIEKKIRCPICGKKMKKTFCRPGSDVCVDECSAGHGLWFDRGELHTILELTELGAKQPLKNFLEDVFSQELKNEGGLT